LFRVEIGGGIADEFPAMVLEHEIGDFPEAFVEGFSGAL
jgi:hypothetical protein